MPTSRRSGQRRYVPESVTNQRRDVGYQRRDVPEGSQINVATLEIHVATFQRGVNSTSRRSRDTQNQRHDIGNPRRDVPEKGKIDVATSQPNVATLQRRLHKNFTLSSP